MRIKMPAVRIAQADVEMQQQHSDVLTCGACQKAFALGDIVKFIQHKVLACNKENYSCNPTPRGANVESGDSDDGGGVGVVNSRRPSISAPIKKVTSTSSSSSSGIGGRVLCTPPDAGPAVVLDDPRCSTPKRRPPTTPIPRVVESATDEEDVKSSKLMNETMVCDSTPPHSSPEEGPCKKLRTDVTDAQSNTTNSEPSNYVCSTCKVRLHSAWRLVQHVQHSHGMKIYVDSTPTSGGGSISSVGSSPGTSSNPGKNQSNSSTCSSSSSGCSSSGGNPTGGRRTPLSLGVPPRLGIPTSSPLVEPHIPIHNPFTMGGILRMPLEPPRHHQFPPSSLGPTTGSLFARPSSHNEHHFRMDQLVSEQFRLSQHHSLGLAAAVAAAATGVPPHHPAFCPPPPNERPSPILPPTSVARTSVPPPPPPPSLPLSLEPQLDFYSQRLRQLAGTTSPGASNDNPSPHRKLTPPFTSPNSTLQQPMTSSSSSNNNNNNLSTTNNNNVDLRHTPSPILETSRTHDEPKAQPTTTPPSDRPDNTIARSTSSPSSKPTDFSMNATIDNVDSSDGRIHACDYCGKKFRFQSNLIVHRRSHTGEKPFKCSVCNHACSQSSKLKRHMKVHKRSRNKPSSSDDGGNPNGHTSLSSALDQASNEGSLGTMDDDEDDDDDMEDDEDDEEEEDDDEDEEMEVEEEEGDEDDDVGGDAPEDLTTKSTSSTPPTMGEGGKGGGSSHTSEKVSSGSLVGELMDKYGLSNIQQYSEAYKQALQESVGAAHHIIKKEEILQRSHFISDNNNIGSKPRLENGFIDKTTAMRFREEFAKNMMAGQPPLDLVGGPRGFFGSPFENPFDASKRLKLEPHDGGLVRSSDRDSLYPSMWLPAMAAHHREHMFGGNGSESDILKGKSKNSSGSSSASLAAAAAAAAALNLGIPPQSLKKESRRNDTCEFCGKVFKNCSNLTVHRRSHTGEKPYKCELCSYACAQSSKLTRHMKTHGRMGKDVYRCRFCEMPFSVPSTLEKHMRKCVVNQNIKVEHILPSMLSGDEDSMISQPKDVATT